MKYHLISIACIAFAGLCYMVGATLGMGSFLVLGLFAEGVFWLRLA